MYTLKCTSTEKIHKTLGKNVLITIKYVKVCHVDVIL